MCGQYDTELFTLYHYITLGIQSGNIYCGILPTDSSLVPGRSFPIPQGGFKYVFLKKSVVKIMIPNSQPSGNNRPKCADIDCDLYILPRLILFRIRLQYEISGHSESTVSVYYRPISHPVLNRQ